jgi:putative serine protease PepD
MSQPHHTQVLDPWVAYPPQPPTGPPAPPEYQPAPPSGSSKGAKRRVAELSLVALLAAGLASGGTYLATRPDPAAATSQSQAITPVSAPVVQADGQTPDWAATAKAVSPSVVAIQIAGQSGEGEGSGVVIDKAGHILTNNHVVSGAGAGATITVTLDDGRTYAATIAGTDPATDLAVITLQNPPSDLTPVSIGDSDALVVGQPVMAVGNPLGLEGTVTTGIVSALNRPVSTGSSETTRGAVTEPVVTNAIQTSAAINPGNSGGALVTANGQLIGINSSIATLGSSEGSQGGNIGIGFAIPSNEAKAIAEQLIANGSAQHAYLGVSSADSTVTDGSSQRAGAAIRSVAAGTPAASAGLQVGDTVVAIDGERVDSSLALVAAIREHQVGDEVTLTVIRGGERVDVQVALVARPTTTTP